MTSPPASPPTSSSKGSAFWLSFIAVVVANFLSALDMTAVSTAVPTMTNELHGGDNFVWIGSAYGLASTAILPFTGRLADVFGRRPIMLISIVIFLVGSALAGAAQNMDWLIAARTVQGLGGGAIVNLGSIILGDLVTLAERGTYQGILILVWALAGAVGPVIAGSLAQDASWRWLFYLNLPLAGISFLLVAVFLRVRTPVGSIMSKLARVDWFGNFIIIAGTTLALLALTWGGIRFSWSSAHVLAPLIVGVVLIVVFFVYENYVPPEPTTPLDVVAKRNALGGYIATFFHGIVTMTAMFYLPVYFQACMEASPIRSSVDMLPTTLICAPVSLITGVIVKGTSKYRPVNFIGWGLMLIGFGLLTLLKADSSTVLWVFCQIITAAGIGMIWSSTVFPILAAVSVTRMAAALAFQNFLRSFAQTWGVTISASILQNELKKRLPPAFIARFPEGIEIAYAAIPVLHTLDDESLRNEVRVAFASAMTIVWQVMIGLAGAGFLSAFLLEELPMGNTKDAKFGLEDGQESKSSSDQDIEAREKAMASSSSPILECN